MNRIPDRNRRILGSAEGLSFFSCETIITKRSKSPASALHLQEEKGKATEAQRRQKGYMEGTDGPMGVKG